MSSEYTYFESAAGAALPFGNGVATGAVMYDWMARTGVCGDGSPNAGVVGNRYYDCRKPELSIVLRTNCQSTLQSQHWRCQSECADLAATVPVALEDTLSSDATWNAYFGTDDGPIVNGQPTQVSRVQRLPGTALYARVPACTRV